MHIYLTIQQTSIVNNNVVVIFYHERKIHISDKLAKIHLSHCQVHIFPELLIFYYILQQGTQYLFSFRKLQQY